MRILVGWDDPNESELVQMYLGVDENEAVVVTADSEFQQLLAPSQKWDVILLSITFPTHDRAYEMFEMVQARNLETPVVGACRQEDVFKIVRFVAHGMRSYVIRDTGGDYMFLLQSILESAVKAVRAERERLLAARLREEVESVRKLQESVIPADLAAPPGYKIGARYEPSQIQVVGGRPVTMAGGDYYDVFGLDDSNLVILVGDASGHGMKAAMSIMTMHTLVRMIRNREYQDTAHFVEEVNNQLADQQLVNDEGGFITLLYGILNFEKHDFQWTSAGHPIPILQNLQNGESRPIGSNDDCGMPLAIMKDVEYVTCTSAIPPNSRLLLCTDGLEEAFPESNTGRHDQFGIDGVMKSLQRTSNRPLPEALDVLFDDSAEFTQGAGRHDDTSVVLLERDLFDAAN